MRLLRAFLFTVFFSLFAYAVTAQSQATSFLTGRVVRITDGDTLWVEVADQFDWIHIRFYGVDAPESAWPDMWPAQPFSAEAKKFIIEQVAGKQVTVRLKNDETYNRAVGEVFIGGKSMSHALLQRGLAWWNRKYEPYDTVLRRLQEEAQAAKIGLWSQENPVPPWVHRRRYTVKK